MRPAVAVLLSGAALVLASAPAAEAAVDPLAVASRSSPFAEGCNGAPQSGTVYRHSEVEPWIDANPTRPDHLVGVWQQDRWSTGAANGNLTGLSTDGGRTWTRPPLGAQPRFSRCAGGNPANGGDYERASDPWVSFGPDGDAYQIALAVNDSDRRNAILVSESKDGGLTWGPNATLISDASPTQFNDKESITADHTDARYVYATWDRLSATRAQASATAAEQAQLPRGPTYFSRTTDGGATWERGRPIFDPGALGQTIGNQIVVMPDGDLVNGFTLVAALRGQRVAVIRSGDKGWSWSRQIVVDRLRPAVVRDPVDSRPVRAGDVLPELASDERPGTDNVYVVWQDGRFASGGRAQIAFSRSSDGGLSWSPATRVSSNVATQAFTPSVDVDDSGNVGVSYYDFTNDTASRSLDTDYWLTRSTDGGLTWRPRERITPRSFDMRRAPAAGGFFVGDYQGLESVGDSFKPLFALARGAGAPRTDVFSTTLRSPFP
jgi:hypothetical protein